MEKYRFGRKLQEAVLRRQEGQQPAIIIDGKEMKVRNPVFVGNRVRDVPCLVEEDNKAGNTGYTVVAVSFDNLNKQEKAWVCIQPVLLEQVIGSFMENHQMEGITGDCRCANRLTDTRDTGFDFETENVCIEIKVFMPVTVGTGSCTWKSFHEAVKQITRHCNNPAVKEKGKRILLLTVCQDGTDQMQSMEDGSIIDELKKLWAWGLNSGLLKQRQKKMG